MSYVFKKVASSYDNLTTTEKKNLFLASNYLKPSLAELQSLEEFECLAYGESDKTKFWVSGVSRPQLVVPVSLIDIGSFEGINSLSICGNISDGGSVKIALTTDMEKYYTFSRTSLEWDEVELTEEAIEASGMSILNVGNLTREDWDKLLSATSTIGFAYLLSMEEESDDVSLDKITINVDMKGTWNHAIYGTDVVYGYPANNLLKVTLKTDGSYKINYNNLGKQG